METLDEKLARVEGFQWDSGNLMKNWGKHGVSTAEAEEMFFNGARFLEDEKHSKHEDRYIALGKTSSDRRLSVTFTLRGNFIRVISARTMSRPEGSSMKKAFKKLPKFVSEDAEREFWATHDFTDYFDLSKARVIAMPNLKLSTETISIRLPKGMLDRIKMMANAKDMPYQSLMKHMLAEKVAEATPPYDPKG